MSIRKSIFKVFRNRAVIAGRDKEDGGSCIIRVMGCQRTRGYKSLAPIAAAGACGSHSVSLGSARYTAMGSRAAGKY